jgi:two-component system phosphate regulon response regulator PhoB
MTANILVVEDEQAIQELIAVNLARAGHSVRRAGSAETAQAMVREWTPDLLLVDWNLPSMSGIDLTRWVRHDARTRHLAVIMLTARVHDHDKITALDAGADDFISKPFSVRELLARIAAVLRRRAPRASTDVVDAGGLRLDPNLRQVTAGGVALELRPTEFRLLHVLMVNTGQVHTRARLLELVWGEHSLLEERAIDAHVRRIRSCLQAGGRDRYLQTVRGVGYRFAPPSE